eukprot:jgi/Mesvir1/8635/Mv02583-RA.3
MLTIRKMMYADVIDRTPVQTELEHYKNSNDAFRAREDLAEKEKWLTFQLHKEMKERFQRDIAAREDLSRQAKRVHDFEMAQRKYDDSLVQVQLFLASAEIARRQVVEEIEKEGRDALKEHRDMVLCRVRSQQELKASAEETRSLQRQLVDTAGQSRQHERAAAIPEAELSKAVAAAATAAPALAPAAAPAPAAPAAPAAGPGAAGAPAAAAASRSKPKDRAASAPHKASSADTAKTRKSAAGASRQQEVEAEDGALREARAQPGALGGPVAAEVAGGELEKGQKQQKGQQQQRKRQRQQQQQPDENAAPEAGERPPAGARIPLGSEKRPKRSPSLADHGPTATLPDAPPATRTQATGLRKPAGRKSTAEAAAQAQVEQGLVGEDEGEAAGKEDATQERPVSRNRGPQATTTDGQEAKAGAGSQVDKARGEDHAGAHKGAEPVEKAARKATVINQSARKDMGSEEPRHKRTVSEEAGAQEKSGAGGGGDAAPGVDASIPRDTRAAARPGRGGGKHAKTDENAAAGSLRKPARRAQKKPVPGVDDVPAVAEDGLVLPHLVPGIEGGGATGMGLPLGKSTAVVGRAPSGRAVADARPSMRSDDGQAEEASGPGDMAGDVADGEDEGRGSAHADAEDGREASEEVDMEELERALEVSSRACEEPRSTVRKLDEELEAAAAATMTTAATTTNTGSRQKGHKVDTAGQNTGHRPNAATTRQEASQSKARKSHSVANDNLNRASAAIDASAPTKGAERISGPQQGSRTPGRKVRPEPLAGKTVHAAPGDDGPSAGQRSSRLARRDKGRPSLAAGAGDPVASAGHSNAGAEPGRRNSGACARSNGGVGVVMAEGEKRDGALEVVDKSGGKGQKCARPGQGTGRGGKQATLGPEEDQPVGRKKARVEGQGAGDARKQGGRAGEGVSLRETLRRKRHQRSVRHQCRVHQDCVLSFSSSSSSSRAMQASQGRSAPLH